MDPVGSLGDQVAVMAAISRRRGADQAARRRLGLFSFAPFCPWRHAEDRTAGRETVLDRVERWASEGHVIGLKLYPPMGFRAFDNGLRSPHEFPAELKVLAGANGHPGTLIDDALREAYGLCERLGLIVMAHCGDSNEAAPGYGVFADPAYWGEALELYPALRVNLGHFGGVFGFADQDAKVRERTQRWASRIAALMDRFPGLHADLGFGQQFIIGECSPTSQCGQSVKFLRRLMESRQVLVERLMHGSDWVMVGMIAEATDYAERALRSLGQLFPGSAIENFRWRNAARLLGLEHDGLGRRRMQRHLEPHAPGLLARFDPALAVS